jgi:hypothetical protein
MRYLILATLMFALGLVVVSLDRPEQTYIPVVRLRTGEGYFITAVQTRTHDRRKCDAANERFIGPILSRCPECVVESVDCGVRLHGFERALAAGDAVPLYTVAARGIRLALVGPPGGTARSCDAIARLLSAGRVSDAACVRPQGGPVSAR